MPLSLPYKKHGAPAGETLLSGDAALACLCQHGKHLTAISAAAAALATAAGAFRNSLPLTASLYTSSKGSRLAQVDSCFISNLCGTPFDDD
jgi:hypothetical protein